MNGFEIEINPLFYLALTLIPAKIEMVQITMEKMEDMLKL